MTNLVEIRDLNIRFTGERTVHAVNDISLSLGEGEVLGLLGESGSGKSVTLRALMRLLPKKRTQISGSVKVLGRDVLAMNDEELSAFRGQTVSMIFQEPALALDPVYTIGQQIAESVMRHEGKSQKEATARALEMLEVVRIPSAKRRLDAYPHEMSGGMRQRAMIALALACKPKILLADEPTTALDATVQIQILLLLRELQREFGMSVIFVTHDIGVAIEICDRVAVMYAGQIVEQGTLRDIVRTPVHPYAEGLLASTVHGAKRGQRLETIPGTPPSLDKAPVELLVRAALQFCAAALHRAACRPMCRCRRIERAMRAVAASWPETGVVGRCRDTSSAAQCPGSAQSLDLRWARTHLLRLMGIERAGARRPALGQDLHREQLGVDFRFEGAGRAALLSARSSDFVRDIKVTSPSVHRSLLSLKSSSQRVAARKSHQCRATAAGPQSRRRACGWHLRSAADAGLGPAPRATVRVSARQWPARCRLLRVRRRTIAVVAARARAFRLT